MSVKYTVTEKDKLTEKQLLPHLLSTKIYGLAPQCHEFHFPDNCVSLVLLDFVIFS